MKLRARILIRDGGMCQCDQCHGSGLTATEVDHRIPLWEGGTDDDSNLQAINTDCHKRKTADEARRRGGGGKSLQP
jgi:5-methylcytosine-specific restriction protein A